MKVVSSEAWSKPVAARMLPTPLTCLVPPNGTPQGRWPNRVMSSESQNAGNKQRGISTRSRGAREEEGIVDTLKQR